MKVIVRSALCLILVGFAGIGIARPALAQVDFLTDLLMSEAQERQFAEQEHPKILEQFGGEYRDADLQTYVGSIANFLGQVSRRPDIRYRLTILNSPVVNAFALPAGYLYVTRGLLALAENEAELAGVVAHEIGHVTARHTAQRFSHSVLAQGIVGLLGAATQNTEMAGLVRLVEPVAVVALQSFSREHEHEADMLGVRSLSRAGYDPRAMASFLAKLGAQTRLDARLSGQGGAGDQFNLLATHPRTAERVGRTIQAAGGLRVRDPMLAKEIYLRKIDGLLFGDDPDQGFVRGSQFIHPKLNFRFEVPKDFMLLNGQKQVTARDSAGAVITFDRAAVASQISVDDYLRQVWAKDIGLSAAERLNVNGLRAASGRVGLQQGSQVVELRFVAIRTSSTAVDRFVFAAPASGGARYDEPFKQTIFSYRRLGSDEAGRERPSRIKLHRVQAGDTVESLSAGFPDPNLREDRFRVINGLAPNQRLDVGDWVKLVVAR